MLFRSRLPRRTPLPRAASRKTDLQAAELEASTISLKILRAQRPLGPIRSASLAPQPPIFQLGQARHPHRNFRRTTAPRNLKTLLFGIKSFSTAAAPSETLRSSRLRAGLTPPPRAHGRSDSVTLGVLSIRFRQKTIGEVLEGYKAAIGLDDGGDVTRRTSVARACWGGSWSSNWGRRAERLL